MRSLSLAAVPRHQIVVAALLSVLVGVALSHGLVAPHRPSPAPGFSLAGSDQAPQTLPLSARGAVSGALGADAAAYRVRVARPNRGGTFEGAFETSSPGGRVHARFERSGVALGSGSLRLALSLRSAGYGAPQTAVRAVAPSARANRVDYARPGLSEWYVNGPAGLEQGFTIARAPHPASASALTLSMTIAGNVHASLDRTGQAVVFSHGASSLRYDSLVTTDATGRELPSSLALRDAQLQIRVDTRGARYPLRVDPLIQQGEKLTGGGEQGEGQFGLTVALSADGDTALIAGSHDDDFAGSVWVFTRSGSSWVQQGEKLTSGEAGGETGEGCGEEAGEEAGECGFGRGLALSADGDTALIGAPRSGDGKGAVWVYTRSGSTWTQGQKLADPSEETSEGHFGRSVALSSDGQEALIGGPADKGGHGAAWAFTRSGSSWKQQGSKLTGAGGVGEGHFGGSVALSSVGDTAVIGGPGDSGYKGAAWAFTRSGSSWSQQGSKLTATDEEGAAHLGGSVALSADGQTALAGGRADGGGLGAAWVFTRAGAVWSQQGARLTGDEELGSGEFGYSVALSSDGDTAVIGAPRDNSLDGAVRLFTRSGSTWLAQPEQLAGAGALGNAWSGASVATSADAKTVLIGAPRDDGRVGAAWAFAYQSAPTLVPTVNKVLPNSGPTDGGTTVKITGTNFTTATAVHFGSTDAASFTVKSATSIVAVSPAGPEGTVDVTVSTPAGVSSTAPPHTRFKYLASAGGGSTPVATPPALGSGAGPGGSGGVLGFGPLAGGASAACKVSLRSKTIAVQPRNRAALRLLRTGTGACRGRLTLSYKAKTKGRHFTLETIGTTSFSIAPGKSQLVQLTLSRTGRALLRKGHGKLNASLAIVRVSPAPLKASTASVRLKLQKPRKAKTPKS
jgi:hypothetical protein